MLAVGVPAVGLGVTLSELADRIASWTGQDAASSLRGCVRDDLLKIISITKRRTILRETVRMERAKAEAKKEFVKRCLDRCESRSRLARTGSAEVEATGEVAMLRVDRVGRRQVQVDARFRFAKVAIGRWSAQAAGGSLTPFGQIGRG
jgi:hypothetical protein